MWPRETIDLSKAPASTRSSPRSPPTLVKPILRTDLRAEFRLRHLLNPFYLIRRCRELGSAEQILRAAATVPRCIRGRCGNVYYELRGLPGLLKARGQAAYYAARGTRGYILTRAERAYYELRGLPGLLKARGQAAYHALRGSPRYVSTRIQNAYYEFRGLPGFVRARAEGLYYKADAPYYRSKLTGVLNLRPEFAAPAEPPAPPPPPPSFEDREPATLLRPEVRREEAGLAERFQAGQPFKHVVIDGFLDHEFCRRLTAEFPPYDAPAFRNEHGHMGKAYHEDVKALGPCYRKLDELIQSPDFLRFASAITGIPDLLYDPSYLGGGVHENLEEMELDPHVDFTVHKTTGLCRRVNLLLYLNPEWDEAWGGGLELHVDPWLPADQNPIKTIAPAFNRCVLFETSDRSWHGFREIRLPKHKKGLTRRSFALYLYTREKPSGFPAIPGDLTVFVDRPLPPEFRPGHRLTEEDVRVLKHLIVRRDWKLRYLYDRSISLYNDWQLSQAKLKESLQSLFRSEPKTKV